jgi:hypothetical protein
MAVGFALEQSLRVAALAVFYFIDLKTTSVYAKFGYAIFVIFSASGIGETFSCL